MSNPPPPPVPFPFSQFGTFSISSHLWTYSTAVLACLGVMVGVLVCCKAWDFWKRRRQPPMSEPPSPDRQQLQLVEAARERASRARETLGFTAEQLSLLGFTFKYDIETASSVSDAEESRKECVVCLSEFSDGELLRSLHACGHTFHQDCVDAWLKAHRSCPLCRSPLVLPEEKEHALDTDQSLPQESQVEMVNVEEAVRVSTEDTQILSAASGERTRRDEQTRNEASAPV